MVVQILLLITGFVFLIGGASWLVDGASCPELFVNIQAAIRGDSAIAIGNILGSNNFNSRYQKNGSVNPCFGGII